MAAICLDLRTGLPKARKQFKRVLEAQKTNMCVYTAPCVIGAMVTPKKRIDMEYQPELDSLDIGSLMGAGLVLAPEDQRPDIRRLQRTFDSGTPEQFERLFSELERKYTGEAQ